MQRPHPDRPIMPSGSTPPPSIAPTPLAVAERGPTPAARVTPANPEFCKVLGQIAPIGSQCAADQIPGESPGRVERPLAAIWRRRLQRRADHRPCLAAGLSVRRAFAAGARLCHLWHGFRPRDQAGRAAAGVCAQRRGVREFCASILQARAGCRRRPDGARLRQPADKAVFHGIVGRRPRGADDGAALSR